MQIVYGLCPAESSKIVFSLQALVNETEFKMLIIKT